MVREKFPVFLIKPSHYDDQGYVIQWVYSEVPSNTMAAVNGIILDCIERKVLGEHVDIEIHSRDETNTHVRPKRILRAIAQCGGRGLVALVGVQTNQFPRAMDLARQLRAGGANVCIGGFHVSGCLAMLPEIPADIQEAIDLGISIFAGEAEGRMDEVLQAAYRNELAPVYNFIEELPGLEDAPIPLLPRDRIRRTIGGRTSFDSGRGCPFQCSFCTIINVQGRKSRYRTADAVEEIIRENHAQGIQTFFITDDNFARNKNWEAIFDRIIELQRNENIKSKLMIQVDTLCHLIPNFVEKAAQAGVNRVFIGLENINPENLAAAKKRQNRITEYRKMILAWKRAKVITYCGYIIGFPGDTRERLLADLEILKRELPIDFLELFCMTPLPGSADHKALHLQGVPMDPDMNNYDLEHVCTQHPKMSDAEFRRAYNDAWDSFYSVEHMETVMRRHAALGWSPSKITKKALYFYGCHEVEGIHPLQGGLFRRKIRKDRRPGMPRVNPLVFYPARAFEVVGNLLRLGSLAWRYRQLQWRVDHDPAKLEYMDLSLTPDEEYDIDEFEMFSASSSAKAEVVKLRAKQDQHAAPAAPL